MSQPFFLTKELSLVLIARATDAPSSHNTQPWRFIASESGVELWADQQRVLKFNDPHHRELTISCGCALLNLRVAAEEHAIEAHVVLLPQTETPDLLARITFSTPTESSPRLNLAEAIAKRHTYRKRYTATRMMQSDLILLAQHAATEHAQLHHFSDVRDREYVESLVIQADTKQWADPSWRKELALWMRSRRDNEGMTVPTLVLPVVRSLVRNIDMGGIVAGREPDLSQPSPALLMLATDTDTVIDWLKSGQALQRVLLAAAQMGLQASYLNQAIQVQSTRPIVATLVAAGCCPQMLFRLGTPAQEVSVTPRRDASETMRWAGR